MPDVINARTYTPGDGVPDPAGIAAWVSALASTYTHGAIPNISANARAGYIPGGIFDADATAAGNFIVGQSYTIITLGTTNFTLIGAPSNEVGESFTATGVGSGTGTARTLARSAGFGWPLNGNGVACQLRDVNIEIDHNRANVQNLRLISEGAGQQPGAGLDIRAGIGFYFNNDISSKDIGIANTTAFNPGGFSSNNTVIGGWLRGNRISVSSAQTISASASCAVRVPNVA